MNWLKKNIKKMFLLLSVLIYIGGIYLIFSTYRDLKDKTIEELNIRQTIHARQAAKGIQNHINNLILQLEHLSKEDAVILMNEEGKSILKLFYESNILSIKAVTRVDTLGRIIYTLPFDQKFIGSDLTNQEHVGKILKNHKLIISDVFMSVQGYQSIAIHFPVFYHKKFAGTLAFLISFDELAKNYVGDIKVGKSGYAWLISQNGTELSCPVPGHVGKSVYETCKDFPDILDMTGHMMKGEAGTTTYHFNRIQNEVVEKGVLKHAVYMPIILHDTFWSIVVATPEDEVLMNVEGFRVRMIIIFILLFLMGAAIIYYIFRFVFLKKEQDKRGSIELALKQSEELYRKLITTIPDIIVRTDLNGIVTFVNETNMGVLNYTDVQGVLGKSMLSFISPDDVEKAVNNTKLMFEKPLGPQEYRLLGGKGEYIDCEVNGDVLYDSNKIPYGMVYVIRNISERKRAEDEIKILNMNLEKRVKERTDQLEAANKELESFAYSVSHDLRAPLRAIDGFSFALHEDYNNIFNSEAKNYLNRIRSNSQKMALLIDDLLTISRLVRIEISKNEIDLSSIAEDTFKELTEFIKGRKISLDIEKGMFDFADPKLIKLCFQNLIDNAIKFSGTKEETKIRIGCNTVDNKKVYFVKDNGVGFNMQYAHKLFGVFQRLHRTDEFPGTGVGLATVQKIIEKHNGRIWAESIEGHGATFFFTLNEIVSKSPL